MLIAIGLMSGSSMDGIDAALVETNGQNICNHIKGKSIQYDLKFHLLLRGLEAYYQIYNQDIDKYQSSKFEKFLLSHFLNTNSPYNLSELKSYLSISDNQLIYVKDIIYRLTILHSELVKALLKDSNFSSNNVDVIGFHGQNVYHSPKESISIQLGDGQLLADLTGILVVNNFRINDINNGGQGAPFAPLYHQVLASKQNEYPIGIINCGGIANLTIVDGKESHQIIGFDTGPGNILIDRFVRIKTFNKELIDKDGKYGLKGTIDNNMFQILKKEVLSKYNENFFEKLPPKSLDPSHFIIPKELDSLRFEDACATLEAFTSYSIVESLNLIKTKIPKIWVLAGGGWKNPVILNSFNIYLAQKIGSEVKIFLAEEKGWHSQFIEAEIFAYLAVRTLKKLPISYPNITDVKTPTFGGQAYIPSTNNMTIKSANLLLLNKDILTNYGINN